jgi:ABC-type multidrug transport system fused ATPase/permease subunit
VAAVAGVALVGVAALVGYLVTYLTAATAERVGADLREAVFGRMLGLALPFHDRRRSGDLVTRLTGDVARVEDSMVAYFTVLVPEVLRNVRVVQAFTRSGRPATASPAAAAAPSGPPWPPWTWRRAGRRPPTCCWPRAGRWSCGWA